MIEAEEDRQAPPVVAGRETLLLFTPQTEIDAKAIDIDELTANGASFKPDSLGLLEYVGMLKD